MSGPMNHDRLNKLDADMARLRHERAQIQQQIERCQAEMDILQREAGNDIWYSTDVEPVARFNNERKG